MSNRTTSELRTRTNQSTDPDALFDVPSELADFYSTLGNDGSLECKGGVVIDDRSEGYKTNGQGKDGTHYCSKEKEDAKFVWWLSNMDVDCDGAPSTEGICEGDGSYFELTAFTDGEGKPVNALTVPYVVINQGDGFDPTKVGVQPLSVVAVICGKGGKLTFGIWADTNAIGSMGEASVNLARICFGETINGNYGHGEADVLYLAFPGSKEDTVPSGSGTDLQAIYDMGHKLVKNSFGATSAEGNESSSVVESSSPSTDGSTTKGSTTTVASPTSTLSNSRVTESASSNAPSPSESSTGGLGSSTQKVQLPSNSTLLIGAGVVLLLSSIITWVYISRRHRVAYDEVSTRKGDSTSTDSEDEEEYKERAHRRYTPRRGYTSASSSASSGSSETEDSSEESEERDEKAKTKRRRRR